ncbi:MAG: hypothetical protein WCR20_01295 [Verrucomicrobiota bacterium]
MANDRVSKALGERFSFTIANTSGAVKIIAILAAFFDTLLITADTDAVTHVTTVTKSYTDPTEIVKSGYQCDAVIDDGTICTGVVVTAANSKMNVRQFRNYILSQPRVLIDLTIQASNVAAFNEVIEVVKVSPLKGAGSDYLPLTDFLSIDQKSENKININGVNLGMMYDTLMLLPINTGHTLTISMKFS